MTKPITKPLTDDQIWGSDAMAAVIEPECPAALAAGGCPPDCDYCENGAALAPPVEARCRVCGCTDTDRSGCLARTGEPCHWIEPNLCSACAGSGKAGEGTE